jgi:tetratricopeptide (TPR) repeat protein
MNIQDCISNYSDCQVGKVILVEAKPGQERHVLLQQWVQEAKNCGAEGWFLKCGRNEGGSWAGVKDLFGYLMPKFQFDTPHLITKHDYELVHVLPLLRKTIIPRYLTLTDIASKDEKVRYHPADRVFRIIHGLVDLFTAWYQHNHLSTIAIACDDYEKAGSLVHRFFSELMRRASKQLNITLILTTDIGASSVISSHFDNSLLEKIVKINLDSHNTICQAEMARLAEAIEIQVREDQVALEGYIHELINYWLLSDRPEKALIYQIKACSIYAQRGYYEDAIVYGEAALPQLKSQNLENSLEHSRLVQALYLSYTSVERLEPALHLLQDSMEQITEQNFRSVSYYMMAMLYARYLPIRDFEKALAYLHQGIDEILRIELPKQIKLLRFTSMQRGVSLIKYRQREYQKAIEIGLSSYEIINRELGDKCPLQQSVLLYTVTQVYDAIHSYDRAIYYLSSSIALDPNYSEYYNHRGNIYIKMGRFPDALNDYLKAIELSPPYAEVWTNVGQCYRLMDRMEEAVEAYTISLDLEPDRELALTGRAQAFEALGQLEAALDDYNQVIKLNSDSPLILANRAILHYEIGNTSEALADLDRAITLAPDNPDLYQNRAVALTAMGRHNDVIRDLQTYLELNPNAEDCEDVKSQLSAIQTTVS